MLAVFFQNICYIFTTGFRGTVTAITEAHLRKLHAKDGRSFKSQSQDNQGYMLDQVTVEAIDTPDKVGIFGGFTEHSDMGSGMD